MHVTKFANKVKRGVRYAKRELKGGARLLLHCAAGIHRTGLFAYTLLRYCGFTQEQSFELIKIMRLKTFTGCGFDRMNLGEEIVTTMLAEVHEAVKSPAVYTFVWMKLIRLKNNNTILDMALSDEALEEYYQGPHLVFKIQPDELESRMGAAWSTAKAKIPGKSSANTTSVYDACGKILVFLKNFLSVRQARLIGIDVGHEFDFLNEFIPDVAAYLDPVPVDLGQYAHQLASNRKGDTKSIMEDFEFFRKAKLKYNITI